VHGPFGEQFQHRRADVAAPGATGGAVPVAPTTAATASAAETEARETAGTEEGRTETAGAESRAEAGTLRRLWGLRRSEMSAVAVALAVTAMATPCATYLFAERTPCLAEDFAQGFARVVSSACVEWVSHHVLP
jgi:hypothetical protein